MDQRQAKGALIDIVKHAYRGSPKLSEYCTFDYVLTDKQYKSKNGDYSCDEKKIRVFASKSADLQNLIKTSIHELAHHIDNCNRGTSDHSALFYEEYKRLLFAALDLRMFGLKEILETKLYSADRTKVKLMVIEYMEQDHDKKEMIKRASKIAVYNAYDIKDSLKNMGFRWDAEDRAWCKELDDYPEGDIARVEDLIIRSGRNITYRLIEPPRFDAPAALPDKFCFHEFTPEERKALLSGEEIYVEKCWSRKRALFFSCYLSWDGEELKPRFGD